MKRLCSLLLSVVFILLMIAPIMTAAPVSADADVVYTIQTVKTSGMKEGNTFTVKITTNQIPKICMVELLFAYDATKVKAVKSTVNGFLAEFAFKNANIAPVEPKHGDPDIGEVWITGMDLNDSSAASGETIATITFEALVDIKSDVKFYCFRDPLAAYAPVNPLTARAVDGGLKFTGTPVKITAESATGAYAAKNQYAAATVTAQGDGLTYTWYVKNPGGTQYYKSGITSNVYKIKMTADNSDRRVYCIVKDKYGNQVRSKTFAMRMKATITSVPATAVYATFGAKASIKIGAAGDGLSYSWYIKNANGTKYSKSSVTGSTYTTALNSTSKGRRVYCVVKDKYGKTAQSKTFILREKASITTQPKNVYGAMGTQVSTTVKARGDGLTYTWYVKNAGETKYSKSSVTGSTYTTKMSSTSKNRLVSCLVKDKYGNTVRTKTIILREAVSITSQPQSVYGKNGSIVSTTVKARGDGLKYTWYVKNKGETKYTKSSVTGATYTTKMNSASKDRLLSCKVTDRYGNEVRTQTVQLKMK